MIGIFENYWCINYDLMRLELSIVCIIYKQFVDADDDDDDYNDDDKWRVSQFANVNRRCTLWFAKIEAN